MAYFSCKTNKYLMIRPAWSYDKHTSSYELIRQKFFVVRHAHPYYIACVNMWWEGSW
jgi:hypothetical protein